MQCFKKICKFCIQPALKILVTVRSARDSKSVHFHSIMEKDVYKSFYEIAAITRYLGVENVNVV